MCEYIFTYIHKLFCEMHYRIFNNNHRKTPLYGFTFTYIISFDLKKNVTEVILPPHCGLGSQDSNRIGGLI